MADVPRFQRKTAFRAVGANQNIPGGTSAVINYDSLSFDLGNNFNLTTNEYIVPIDGVYQFSQLVVCAFVNANTSRAYVSMETTAGPTEINRGSDMSYTAHAGNFVFSLWMSTLYHLTSQTAIRLRAHSVAGSPFDLLGNSDFHYWSGYRIESESRTILGG